MHGSPRPKASLEAGPPRRAEPSRPRLAPGGVAPERVRLGEREAPSSAILPERGGWEPEEQLLLRIVQHPIEIIPWRYGSQARWDPPRVARLGAPPALPPGRPGQGEPPPPRKSARSRPGNGGAPGPPPLAPRESDEARSVRTPRVSRSRPSGGRAPVPLAGARPRAQCARGELVLRHHSKEPGVFRPELPRPSGLLECARDVAVHGEVVEREGEVPPRAASPQAGARGQRPGERPLPLAGATRGDK